MGLDKVLIIGSGGREHALGFRLAQSPNVSEVIYAPGNAGTQEGKCRNIKLDGTKPADFDYVYDYVSKNKIGLVLVGPEAPLAAGLVDRFNAKGYQRVFGPQKSASLLESDKFFSYDIMERLSIPQAQGMKCYGIDEALDAIDAMAMGKGVVIKARGLTGGKGVAVCDSAQDAKNELAAHSSSYGSEVLIAERLFGEEFSVFGISDGDHVIPLGVSLQDHKRLLDCDKGPNTGGMGAYGPAPIAPRSVVSDVAQNIMTPVIQRMRADGAEYKGFLYAGMMMTDAGLKVIEFNIRFGDPECQPAMMMIKSDLYEALDFALDGKLDKVKLEFNPGYSLCVVLASNGYPHAYKAGLRISGLEKACLVPGVKVFHAGTSLDGNGLITSGGRVLGVTAYSDAGLAQAKRMAYAAAGMISIPGGFAYRTDIGDKGLGTKVRP